MHPILLTTFKMLIMWNFKPNRFWIIWTWWILCTLFFVFMKTTTNFLILIFPKYIFKFWFCRIKSILNFEISKDFFIKFSPKTRSFKIFNIIKFLKNYPWYSFWNIFSKFFSYNWTYTYKLNSCHCFMILNQILDFISF